MIFYLFIYLKKKKKKFFFFGGGGGGGGYRHTDQANGSLHVYFVVQIPPFIGRTWSAGEECGATAEITRSLQIDLVLSDATAMSEP